MRAATLGTRSVSQVNRRYPCHTYKAKRSQVIRHFKVETKEFWMSKGYDSVPKDVKEYCEYWTKWQGTDEHSYFGSSDPCHAGEDAGEHPLMYVHEKYPDVLSLEEVNAEFDKIMEPKKFVEEQK
eukprot:TRINITY_DN1728_c0_g2_i1.p2 TRINITY_DN1728_c0_g2~~TRINITY_DN1728_c0_g2_i1.p2  ORF type:complete len:125 (-),score=7.14 TRINITY_DN1728_c0_g2_i1:148-522(-)